MFLATKYRGFLNITNSDNLVACLFHSNVENQIYKYINYFSFTQPWHGTSQLHDHVFSSI